jgi:hypothetical protein
MSTTAPAFSRTGPGLQHRVESIPIRRLGNFTLGAVFVAATGALRWINLAAAPTRSGDEGLLVQRAWVLDTSGSFGRLTDWYDHPPLGWLVLSLWTSATSAFDRAPTAIAAARSLSLAAAVATAGLVWLLGRRLGLHRWTTALAVVLLGASPLAVELQRVVSLDGLALPWLVAAFVLAAHPRRPLVAFAGSAACLAVAVLTNETSLLFAPVLVWQLHQAGPPSIRRYGFVVGGSLFAAAGLGYVVHAAVHGSLTAGDGHAGLLEGLRAQLFDRPPTGNVFTNGSFAQDSVTNWFALDPLGPALMLPCAVGVLLAQPKLRAYAACALIPVGLALVPGFASPTVIVTALPFGALVVAATAQHLWAGQRVAERDRLLLGFAVAASVSLAAVALWAGPHRRLLADDSDTPARDAVAWVSTNVPATQRVLVDEALWTDLAASLGTDRLASYKALDRDPAVVGRTTGDEGIADRDWRTFDVVVATEALRRWPERYPSAAAALGDSRPVATFGIGADRIELRRIVTEDTAAASTHDLSSAVTAGMALSRNPKLSFSEPARANLLAGEVDMRLMTTLVAVGGLGPVDVTRFPADPAEGDLGAPRRSAVLHASSDEQARAITELLHAQAPPYRPSRIDPGPDGRLTITYTPAALL